MLSLDELKEVANKVRKAGGGNPIDALLPAVPQDPSACLIAKNLNFNCRVEGAGPSWRTTGEALAAGAWLMVLDDEKLRDNIAEATGWEPANQIVLHSDDVRDWAVVLPDDVGAVADAFDNAWDDFASIMEDLECREVPAAAGAEAFREAVSGLTAERRERLTTLWPYIEESTKEAYNLADVVNERGEIIL